MFARSTGANGLSCPFGGLLPTIAPLELTPQLSHPSSLGECVLPLEQTRLTAVSELSRNSARIQLQRKRPESSVTARKGIGPLVATTRHAAMAWPVTMPEMLAQGRSTAA